MAALDLKLHFLDDILSAAQNVNSLASIGC
jgi:hypothetical protein